MNARTTFLGKLLGIYLIIVAIAMAANKVATIQTVEALVRNEPLVFVLGLILVAAGLAMILSLGWSSGGALLIVLRLISWLTLAKGLVFSRRAGLRALGFAVRAVFLCAWRSRSPSALT
ncbi:MAG TPA: hypothetical protein VFO25_01585 [Candidatus Eremiobacteraceae bacterium]|nr:hypothetical protein [Candidatus Eremiobacteraceae bacterium]